MTSGSVKPGLLLPHFCHNFGFTPFVFIFFLCRSLPDILTRDIGNNAKALQNLALSLESLSSG